MGNVYLLHKLQEGYADLTFPNASISMDEMTVLVNWLYSHGVSSAIAVPTGKAGAIRISVPPLAMREPFENAPKEDLDACFRAIGELTAFANIAACAQKLGSIRKQDAANKSGKRSNGSKSKN